MLKHRIMMIYLSLLLISSTIHALPQEGTCVNYDFSAVIDSNGVIDTNQLVRVLSHNAPVYPTADSNTPNTHLGLGQYFLPVQVDNSHKRIQVRKVGIRAPLGWLEAYDLLCAVTPLQSDKGLDRKVFIKTPDSQDPNTNTVPAYPAYQGLCHGRCKQLSRFRLYFIFAEDKDNQRYLVSDNYTLEVAPPPPLVGWIAYANSIPWNTTLGIRPKEGVERISLTPKVPTGSSETGIELGGGKIWYTFPIHLPTIDINKKEQLYHVAAPSIGMQGFKPYQGDVLATMKQVDVFFLLDGTASMGPYIKAARQAAQDIAEKLRKVPEFKETSFRFGFRVYRDVYADSILKDCQGGICEGLPLSSLCESDSRTTDENWQHFTQRLSQVQETRNDNDDYPEKLFDGLRQAILDMASCPKLSKLLFVIGDHGDKQSELPQDIVDGLKYTFDKTVIFFIQTPNEAHQVGTSAAYQQAYNSYKTQALQLLDKTLPTEFGGQPIARSPYFLPLNQTELPTTVVEQVKLFSRSDVINELEQALASGDSLRNILNRSIKAGGMPILYWKWLEDTACSTLGEQCDTIIDHRVIDFYMPVDHNKIQEEVWLTTQELTDWLSLLKLFEDLVGKHTVREQREKFVKLLRKQIQEIIGGYPAGNITLSESLATNRKKVLPMRDESPLLQYTFDEIREEIEGCELKRLVSWVKSIRTVLQKVYNDSTQKVTFTLEYPPMFTPSCFLSDKGRKVPKLTFGEVQALGPDDTYRYDHTLYGQTVYWLPIEFLP